MRSALQRLPLERATQVTLIATVVAFVCGSSSLPRVLDAGLTARWVLLGALFVVATLWAAAQPWRLGVPAVAILLPAALLELAVVSAAWSVAPRLTLERAVSFGLLLGAAVSLAQATAGRTEAVRRLLLSLLASGAIVAVLGGLVLLFRHRAAVAAASKEYPARYEGFGQNPNTVAMLLALLLPIAVWLLVTGDRRLRVGAGATTLVFAVSIAASGSRGALLAALVGLIALALLAFDRRRTRLLVIGATVLGLVVAVGAIKLQKPLSTSSAPTTPPAASTGKSSVSLLDAQQYRRLQDDDGHPRFGSNAVYVRRTLLGSSGRAQAWQGAIRQGAARPAGGYGFGTEPRVFVDHYFAFDGSYPENSYIGIFLQLGVLGLVVLLLALLTPLVSLVRVRGRLGADQRQVAAVCAAVVVAGLTVAVSQSYLYSVGNVATASVWIALLLLSAALSRSRRDA